MLGHTLRGHMQKAPQAAWTSSVFLTILFDDVRTWVSDDIDLSIARPDHQCICADVWLQLTQASSLHDSGATAAEGEHQLSWACDVHTHAARLQWHLKHRLHSTPKRCLRKKHLSEATVELIQHKKRALRVLQRAKADSRVVRLQICFSSWRSHVAHGEDAPLSTFHCDLASAIAQEK